jgi:hypothetical protein
LYISILANFADGRFPRSKQHAGLRRAIAAAAAFAGLVVLLYGCKKQGAPESQQAQQRVEPSKLSDAEFRFGVSATRNGKVTYQPDVIVVEHGAEAIRSANSDGISVTIDANLPEAAQFEPGKVVFLTSRAAGRVLAAQRDGNDLRLFLGPVEITDIIKDADLSTDQPLDLNSMVAYTAPDYPGAQVDAPKLTRAILPGSANGHSSVAVSLITPSGEWRPVRANSAAPEDSRDPAVWTDHDIAVVRNLALSRDLALPGPPSVSQLPAAPGLPKMPSPQPVAGIPSTIDIGEFKLAPFCCGGIGLKIEYEKAGLKFMAYAVIRLQNPKLHFDLNIVGGKVQRAGVTLDGAAGLTMQFEAGTSVDVNAALNNIGKEVAVPVDFSVPIVGLPVPFAVTLKQAFILKTAFSAKTTTLKATGDYGFTGSFFMGFRDGQWTVSAPTGFTVKQSLINTIEGVSVGVNGIVLAYQGKVIVGVGAFGFVTGPYLGYNASVGFSRGSDLSGGPMGLPVCRGATLDIQMAVGVGYSVPQPVASAINFVLRAMNIKEIQGSSGLEHREKILNKEQYSPEGCEKK